MQANPTHIANFRTYLGLSRDVKELAAPLNDLKISYFTFTRIEKSGGRIYLSNTPETLQMYFQGEYYRVGNVEGDPSKYKSQVVMWDTLPNQYIYNEIPRAHNIDHGLFLIDPHEGYCDFYGLATQKGNDRIINTYLSHMEELKNFAKSFPERAEKLIRTADENKIILPFNPHVNDDDFNQSHWSYESQRVALSQRQFEIAGLLLKGNTVKEIAKVLQLSPRTVESYINNLKDKLNCSNKTALIMALVNIL